MIGSLRGTVLERTDESTALVEVGGVGYLVAVTPRTLLGHAEEEVKSASLKGAEPDEAHPVQHSDGPHVGAGLGTGRRVRKTCGHTLLCA